MIGGSTQRCIRLSRELRLMPDRAENDFAIMRCRARAVPLRTANERLSDASASAAQEYERRRVRVTPAHYPLVTQRGRSSAKKYQARTPDSKSGEGKSRERKRRWPDRSTFCAALLNMAVEPLAVCYPGLAGGTLRAG